MRRLIAVMFAIMLLFSACGSKAEEPSAEPSATAAPTQAPTPTPTPTAPPTPTPTEPPPVYPHPLTGEPLDEDLSQNRPYAVMINNIEYAMPQCGISNADIIYEVLAEGGITRMLAVFSDISADFAIGSMRSVRLYYMDIANSYDAILVHAGGSEQAYYAISVQGVDNVDGVRGWYGTNVFYRDQSRMSAGYEHSLFTSSTLLREWTPQLDISQRHEEGFDNGLRFKEDARPEAGQDAASFTVKFGGWKTSSFALSETDGLYYMRQYGQDYIDGNTGEAPGFANVLILYAATSVIDNDGRLAVTLTGSGGGHFVNGGKMVDITWSRDHEGAPFSYALNSGGELELGIGKTFICIVPSGTSSVTINS